jgi:hypothetical protein
MPKNVTRQNAAVGHIKKAAQDKSSRFVQRALKGEASIGRVDKNLGQYFQVSYYDKDNKQLYNELLATPCGSFCAKGKVRVRICVGDMVVLDGVQDVEAMKKKGKSMVVEITGKFEGRDLDELLDSADFPKCLRTAATGAGQDDDDGGIEFDRSGTTEDSTNTLQKKEEAKPKRQDKNLDKAGIPTTQAKSSKAATRDLLNDTNEMMDRDLRDIDIDRI